MLALCRFLRDKYSLAVVTNDIFTKEDDEFLVKNGAPLEERIMAVETGGCPHAAIREDISINLGPLEELSNLSKADLLLCESSGAGDKIPGKASPGITQADLMVINKTDLAAAVGADFSVMERDALRIRDGGPFVFTQIEMMSEAIDETLDKDEAEEETEDLTNQVLDEIGVGVASQLSSAPKGRTATKNAAPPAATTNNSEERKKSNY